MEPAGPVLLSTVPVLPLWQVVEEQRYNGIPKSELDRLDRIDPDVDEVGGTKKERASQFWKWNLYFRRQRVI